MSDKTITLYPSNWLYNAGVMGLINSIEMIEQKEIYQYTPSSGEVEIKLPFFNKLNTPKRYFVEDKEQKIASLICKNQFYKNYLQPLQKETFSLFVRKLDNAENNGSCQICNNGFYLTSEDQNEINVFDPAKAKFLDRIKTFNMVQNSELGPSVTEFPNGFWNMNQGTSICHLCNFILIHYHLALTKLSDYSEIFINAPSFKLMYELNKIVKESYGSTNNEESRNKRELLAMTIIEHSNKIKTTLGMWAGMNIEIVTKKRDEIEFFSLPYDIIKIISDRNIAALLSELGEFKILNMILDRKSAGLIDFAYKLLRISTKDFNERNKSEKDLINDLLFRFENKTNLTRTINKILKLYSLIEDKNKRS